MSETEHSCRICRGEATPQQPLIHPCKCRGSIKYIHQECLMEWLEHMGNKAKKCDICNTAYRFVTLYDPNMPEIMPVRDIYEKLLNSAKNTVIKHISAALYLVCTLQIPIYWKLVSRLCTYAVDGKMPSPNFSLFHIAAYGAYSRTRNGHLFSSPEATSFEKFATFSYNTYFSGVFQVILCVLVLFVIFIEREWVIREEGYTRSLLRDIGKEPKMKLADLLGQIVENRGEEGANARNPENPENGVPGEPQVGPNVAAREEMAARALEYLQNEANGHFPGENLREALNNGRFDELFRNFRENEEVPERGEGEAGDNEQLRENEEMGETNELNVLHGADQARAPVHPDEHENLHNLHPQVPQNPQNHQNPEIPQPTQPPQIPQLHQNLHEDSDEEPAEELERQRNIEEDERAVAEAGDMNGNFFEMLGLRLHIITPIQLTFMLDSAALLLLFFVYFLPQILGSFVALVLTYASIGFDVLFVRPAVRVAVPKAVRIIASKALDLPILQLPAVKTASTIIHQHFIAPVVTAVGNVFTLDRVDSPDYLTRFFYLVVGYAVVCFAVHQFMAVLNSGNEPVTGSARNTYKLLFQIKATAKVFAIFAIEIVLFPVYCGWLLDFCLTPLLVADLVRMTDTGPVFCLFFTSASDVSSHFLVRFALYWMWGTAYMFCIALFVSMTRNHILRPGVLYFIKSPEDPNARLIHDAIVKPFWLQMSRILLSAKVYSAFIVLGIGLVTWGLRFLVNPPGDKGALLPIKHFSLISLQFAFITTTILFKFEVIITKYCRLFWKQAFAAVCHKLRLSHFILGSPVPQERGHVIYRSTLDGIFQVSQPDYAKPVGYHEAMAIFAENPAVNACFVPNGSYVRAPSSDDNSRRFLRSLFVAVTKSDQLISNEVENTESDTDWWDADVVCEDSYTVVYSPPNIRLRCLGLVCMVSIFGALLFTVIVLAALFAGRPMFRAWSTLANFFASVLSGNPNHKIYDGYEWAYIDLDSLCTGLLAQLVMLVAVDSGPESVAIMDFAAIQRRRLGAPAANFRGLLTRIGLFVAYKFIQIWFLCEIHLGYVAHLEHKLFGTSLVSSNGQHLTFRFTRAGFAMHTFLGLWTLYPFVTTLTAGIPEINSIRTWAHKVGAVRLLPSLAIIVAHRLYSAVYGNIAKTETQIYVDLAVLASVILVALVTNARSTFRGITEQIKSEKYARGTAVQNIDVDS